jgi:hypothetical protein
MSQRKRVVIKILLFAENAIRDKHKSAVLGNSRLFPAESKFL